MICGVSAQRVIRSTCLVQIQQDVWTESLYELFFFHLFDDDVSSLISLVVIRRYTGIASYYKLFVCGLLLDDVMNSTPLIAIRRYT